MGKVRWHTSMSLDGFIAGPNHSMDWMGGADLGPDFAQELAQMIESTGAALAGRRGYDAGRAARAQGKNDKIWGGAWSGPIHVLTHEPPTDEDDPAITFVGGDIREAVATALAAADGKNLLVLGAITAQQCLDAGMVDEIQIHLLPILLGDGIRLFGRPGPSIDLETVSIRQNGTTANLLYTVPR